jgi:hypothetical protein
VFRLTNRRLSIPHLYLFHTYHITILFLFHPVLIKDDYGCGTEKHDCNLTKRLNSKSQVILLLISRSKNEKKTTSSYSEKRGLAGNKNLQGLDFICFDGL